MERMKKSLLIMLGLVGVLICLGVWALRPLAMPSTNTEIDIRPKAVSEEIQQRWDTEQVRDWSQHPLREEKPEPLVPVREPAPVVVVKEEPIEPEPLPPPTPDFDLILIMHSGTYAQAVIRTSDGQSQTVRVGDRIEGFEVLEINRRELLCVTSDYETVTIKLPGEQLPEPTN